MKWLLIRRPFSTHGCFKFHGQNVKSWPRFTSSQPHEPLRILYCGSDDFSAVSLQKLREESLKNPNLVASIDVVCKAGKPSGRGMRKIRDVPIKEVAEQLDLPLHEIPTFTGWSPPKRDGGPVNLIIAVSFGLLVPIRLLAMAKYGGLNLHPSLLPELRGPAPLQHTILNGLQESGISLQTLHPKKFDHGVILAQESFPLCKNISNNFNAFRHFMSERAANLLVTSLRKGLYLSSDTPASDLVQRLESHAPKLTSGHAHIQWTNWSADEILRHQIAIGPLWSTWMYADKNDVKQSLRIVWHDLQIIDTDSPRMAAGFPCSISNTGIRVGGIWTSDGHFLSPTQVTIEGRKKGWPGDSERVVKYLWSLTKWDDLDSISAEETLEEPRLS